MNDRPLEILVVTASPDGRDSTANLGDLVEELRRRPDANVRYWFLRRADHQVLRPGTRVVDSLRTWWPARLLELVGLGRLAAGLRGLRLRSWMGRRGPDVVLLDDGLGERIVDHVVPQPAVIVRCNVEPPLFAELEPTPRASADLWIVPASSPPVPAGEPFSIEHPFHRPFRYPGGRRFAAEDEREAQRRTDDVPVHVPLVVGWGDDGWLDGPDLFVRALWALEHRHGVHAHGVWYGLGADPHEGERIRREAARCGLAQRFHLRPGDTVAGRLSGDAVLLPYRSSASADDLLDAVRSGAAVVTFRAADVDDPMVTIVDDLDVEAAAAALAEGLAGDRRSRVEQSRRRFEPGPLADDVLTVARAHR